MQNKILIDYDNSVKDISYMLRKKYEEFSKLRIKKHLVREFSETINSYKYYFPDIEFQWVSNYINLMYSENNFKHFSIILIELLEKISNSVDSTSSVNISNIFITNKYISTVLFINQKILYERIKDIDENSLSSNMNVLQQVILKIDRDENGKFKLVLDLYKKLEVMEENSLRISYEIENSYFNTANILKNVILINIK